MKGGLQECAVFVTGGALLVCALPAEYGIEGIPATFLIDPKGKIAAIDLHGDALKTAIKDALRKP